MQVMMSLHRQIQLEVKRGGEVSCSRSFTKRKTPLENCYIEAPDLSVVISVHLHDHGCKISKLVNQLAADCASMPSVLFFDEKQTALHFLIFLQ
jgi:hypothetical protein